MTQSRTSVVINTQSSDALVSFVPFLKTAPMQQKVTTAPEKVITAPVLKKDILEKVATEEKKVEPKQVKPLPIKKDKSIVSNKTNSTTISKKSIKLPVKKEAVQKNRHPLKKKSLSKKRLKK